MSTPIQGVPPTAQPWAREVDTRLAKHDRALGIIDTQISSMPNADKAVFAEFNTGQITPLLANNGRFEPTVPVAVRYASSTGLFEVTVSMAGMVRDGALLGASFESNEYPYQIYYNIPKYGVVHSATTGDTAWSVFSASYATILSTKPGVYDFNMYLYSVVTASINSDGFIHRIRLSVKAV